MKKKILSGLLALTLVTGFGAALPQGAISFDSTVKAGAEDYTDVKAGSITYRVYNFRAEAISCDGSETDVVIPETVDGKKVTVVSADLFKDKTKIKSVSLPDTVTSIGQTVFTSLREVNFP